MLLSCRELLSVRALRQNVFISDAKQLTDDPVKADIDVQLHLKSDEPLYTMTAGQEKVQECSREA